DRLVYRGFRIRDASPQTMMIASLGVALIMRSVFYLRFGAGSKLYAPDADWKLASGFRDTGLWRLDTIKMRLVLGDRSIEEGSTYRQFSCEETIDEATGEAVLTRIVTEGSKPAIEIYDVTTACVQATTNYPHYKGISVFVVFSTALLLLLLLNKTRLGRRMRAVADNPELAASSGINVERVQMTSAFLSGAICGVGGVMYGITVGNFEPGDAFKLLLPAFAVIVLGTIGSIRGAIVASFIIAFSRAVSNPVLQGVGGGLSDRGTWMALSEVVPYVTIIAILMIMPEGVGDAWEKWRIDRLRNKRQYIPEESSRTTAALAILPTGAFGLHHWHRGRSDKASTFSAATIAAYVFHRFSRFVSRESFSEGACNSSCDLPLREMKAELDELLLIPEPTSVDANRIEELRLSIDQFSATNLEMLTERNDGTLLLEDSPFSVEDSPTFSGTATDEDETWLSEVGESWLDLMQAEIDLVNLISDLGDLTWPLVPLLIWAFAAYEGVKILRNNGHQSYERPSAISALITMRQSFQKRFQETISPVKQTFTGASESIASTWHRIDNWHSDLIVRSRILRAPEILNESITGTITDSAFPYGRRGRRGSWLAFLVVLAILVSFMAWLPISPSWDAFRCSKALHVSNMGITLSIFILMAFSLNLHTGYTGMV
ncbi:MAG: branched-chain amino acid ABC transporter permease, partial [Candidatus Thalassarchaeum sp.]|nr:branched-chain amino acid ABC transporter permease [Candidatus Thalassarchaeum sp.]